MQLSLCRVAPVGFLDRKVMLYGENNYLGGNTIVSSNGTGWSYDECEVKNEIIKYSEQQRPELAKSNNTKKSSFKYLWRKYVKLTAAARLNNQPDKLLPVKIKHKLRKTGRLEKFERDVAEEMEKLQKSSEKFG